MVRGRDLAGKFVGCALARQVRKTYRHLVASVIKIAGIGDQDPPECMIRIKRIE
ncbi:MAG TPA: hypothetical protein VK726_04490 [Acetobacteraceae bacterium]|nr:hypothetical protein [Acetobacteraceae bacterium]